DGSFVRGHGVTGVSHLGAGRWVVTFTSNVAGCAYLATVADPSNQLVFTPGLVYAQTAGTTATGVYVETKNLAGGLQDYPYHLTIDCPTTRRFAVVAANGTFVRGSHALG